MIIETINEQTGEILFEWDEEVSYKSPKPTPPLDGVYDEDTLKKYCSDPSRKSRGDIGYLVDFLSTGGITQVDMLVLKTLCLDVQIHNFAVSSLPRIASNISYTERAVRGSIKHLQSVNLLKVVNTRFYEDGTPYTLYWIHPKIAFKGSYFKWRISCAENDITSLYTPLNTYEI